MYGRVSFDHRECADVKARKCTVCEGRAEGSHFGVDSCRACAAFFRRTLITKRRFECSSGRCGKPRDCKKCRFDGCIAAGMLPTLVLHNKSLEDDGCLPIPNIVSSHPEIILLHRLMANYQDFTRERFVFEQAFNYARSDAVTSRVQLTPHDEAPFTVYMAKFDQSNAIYRGVSERSIKYLMSSFDEMHYMHDEHKFIILQNFIFLLLNCESFYRSSKTFKERPMESKSRELTEEIRDMLVPILDRMALTEIEFVATMVLALWSLAASENMDPRMSTIGESYRKRVFAELHVLYRDEFKLDNYATRLGELMALSDAVQTSVTTLMSELQFFNLCDAYAKDSFLSNVLRKPTVKEELMY